MVVSCLLHDENQVETKHVETTLVPRLDEGSNPSISTKCSGHSPAHTRQNQYKRLCRIKVYGAASFLDPVPQYLLMQGRCIFEEISQVEEGM